MSGKPGVFLRAEWRYLVMLNYQVDPSILAPYVPNGTELDSWEGKTFVSMVGFRFLNTRVLGMPIPFHRHFDEVNLRFYVRRRAEDGWRRGVVFVKEIVPRFMIAWVARTLYNEKYVSMPMRHHLVIPDSDRPDPGMMSYEWWHAERWNRLAAETTGTPKYADPGSEESFITEHYYGYAAQRDGTTMEYGVEHPPWRVWRTEHSHFECAVQDLYAPEFVAYLSSPPSSAFVAEGSEVIVRRGIPLVRLAVSPASV